MALKELRKPTHIKHSSKNQEENVNKFISKGGTLAIDDIQNQDDDHRLTLRIPKCLMDKVDEKRKKRIGKISRNLWILELIEKATR